MIIPEAGPVPPEMQRGQKEDSRQDSESFLDYLYAKANKKGVPLHGTFELTPICNFRCRMCYVQMTPEQMGEHRPLSTEQWKDLMRQAWEAGMINATLTGGECLAYPGFRELYLYLQSLGVQVDIMTNGSLLNEDWVRFFQEHEPVGIQITLYGGDEDAYERVTGRRMFGTVLENIRRIQEAGLNLKLTITPNRFLGEGIFDTIRLAKQFDKNVVINTYLEPPREETGRPDQDYDLDVEFYSRIFRFLKELDGEETRELPESALPPIGGPCHEPVRCGLQCSAGRSNYSIDWKGAMHPCSSLEFIEGLPLEEGFASAWRRISQAAFSWPQVPECEGCAYETACTICAARKLRFAGPGERPAALCEQIRYLVKRGAQLIPACE